MNGRRVAVVLLAILLAAAAVRTLAFRGYVGLDDGEYARLAYEAAAATPAGAPYGGPAVFPLRVGLTYPTALAFLTLGFGEWQLSVYPFLISLGTVALAYVCGALFFDRRAGLFAAAIAAMMTWQVEAATTLLPDLPGTFYGAAGVAIMVFALSRDHKPGWVVGAGVLAGLMFGASWLCKESVVYSIPFCALLLTFRWRAGIPLGIGMLIGVVAIFGGEMLAYGYSAGDPLFRLHETERNYSQNAKYFFTEGSRWGWPVGESFASAVRRRLFVSGPATIFLNRQALFAPLLAAVAVMYGLASRDRRFFAPALWFLTLALAFNFASSSLSVYRPLVLFDRYLLPVFFAATVLCGGLLSALLWPTERAAHGMARIGGRVAGLCLAGGLFWVASTEVYLGVKYRPRWWAADVRVLADTIQPHDRVFADTLSLRGLRFFQAYPTPTSWTDFDEIDAGTRLPVGSTIIVNQPYLNWLRTNGGLWGDRTSGYAGDAFLATIAANWTVVWHGENTTVYRVDERAAEESVARRPISNVP